MKQLAAAPQQSLVKKTKVVLFREVIRSLQDLKCSQGGTSGDFCSSVTSSWPR